MRYLMDVVPLDARLIRGSHGRIPDRLADGPVLVSSLGREALLGASDAHPADVAAAIPLTRFPELALRALGLAAP